MQPLVSIITINYNNADGLLATINSVVAQSFRDFEFVIIDGGSSDGSKAIIEAHSEYFSHWVSEPDKGIFDAQNKGIAAAKGQYLLFLNSADCLYGADALKDFVQAPQFKGDIVYGDYMFQEGYKKFPDSLYDAYFYKTSLPHQSTLFKASVFEKMGGYDLQFPISADRAFYIKCYLSREFEFVHVPVFLTLFDLTGISNDPRFDQKKLEEDHKMLKACYGDLYQQVKEQVQLEQKQSRVPKYSAKGIFKRIKKRLRDL